MHSHRLLRLSGAAAAAACAFVACAAAFGSASAAGQTGTGALGPLPGRTGAVIHVPARGDLQAAIDRAKPGDTITLAPGATYVGSFELPVKAGSQFITIRTEGDEGLPRPGQRVSPVHASRLAKLRSPTKQPTLRTKPGAHHWRLMLLEFPPIVDGFGDIVTLGESGAPQVELSQVPSDIIIDRCYIYGDPEKGQKRGIALNSGRTTISNSYIADIKGVGQDTQAIAGWNGPGPYTIENNYLEGSGENFMLGGADPTIQGLVPSDVTFRRNHLSKPLEWRDRWLVKNLFELKNARRVLVEDNLMEYSWRHGQVGYAILLTPRNQDGRSPWSVVEDVTIRRNIVRHAGGGMQITGRDDNHPSQQTRRIRVVDNLFYDIDAEKWGGSGVFVLIGEGPADVTIEHNTVSQSGNILLAYGGGRGAPEPIRAVVLKDNLVRHNQYGIHGSDRAIGADTLDAYFPGILFSTNGIAGGDARLYPSGNTFIGADDFERQFVNPSGGDYRLKPESRFRRAASDGKDVGADVAALMQALGWRSASR